MRIFVAQLNPTVGDLEGNSHKILHALEVARSKKADMVVFAELALCGYPPEDLVLHPSFIEAQEKYLEKIVSATEGLMAFVGLVRRNPSSQEKPIFNSVAVIHNRCLLGFQDKRLLPTYDVFDESRYFAKGTQTHIWEFQGKKIAVLICEDIWEHAGYVEDTHYTCDPVQELIAKKPDLIINPSASPYHFQKPDLRLRVCAECAKTLHCPAILCCQVGGNDQLVFDGYSAYLDAQGRPCQMARGFEEDALLIDYASPPSPIHFEQDSWRDLYCALVLGVRDYFHKSGFKKACLGLSGGVDSALVACIAVDALGKDNVMSVAMPSRYSSKESLIDAQQLAGNLGIELLEIPIEQPFQSFLDLLTPFFKDIPFNIAEENMQARIRGLILMALSNKLRYIVLSTGNKSELGMGYCTLYGDMCGGLAVISDVTKQQVYALCRYLNRDEELIPESILIKPPSAELKPNQKDSDTLPEYAFVDNVLEGYVEDYLSPEEIADKYKMPLAIVQDLVQRIHCAEYKRRQAPPGIRVSRKAFRIGRSYPIVQHWI